MAFWLANAGHEVRVVASPPYYPEWKVQDDYSGLKFRKDIYRNNHQNKSTSVTVYRCPIWVPKKISGLKRLLHLCSFSIASAPRVIMQIFWRPQVIITIEPPLFCAPVTLLASALSGAHSWLHIQDFEVDAAFDLGILKINPIRKLVFYFESLLFRSFDGVSTISEGMHKKLLAKGAKLEKTTLFPNWIDNETIYPQNTITNHYRDRLDIKKETFVALYSGNMGEKQDLVSVINAARLLKPHKNILFVLCGEGSAREGLERQAKDLTNVLWLPLQPPDHLNDLLNLANIHLLPQKGGLGDLMMPSKLLGMLASGKPILAMAEKNTDLEALVVKCGEVVLPGDSVGLAQAIERLQGQPQLRSKMGTAARELSLQQSREKVLSDFVNALKKICI